MNSFFLILLLIWKTAHEVVTFLIDGHEPPINCHLQPESPRVDKKILMWPQVFKRFRNPDLKKSMHYKFFPQLYI